jgi:hypothetical protein
MGEHTKFNIMGEHTKVIIFKQKLLLGGFKGTKYDSEARTAPKITATNCQI